MFGDNESVVNSSVIKDSGLRKRHIALSFHHVRESMAAGIVRFCHIPGKRDPADVFSKHWDHSPVIMSLKLALTMTLKGQFDDIPLILSL